MNNEDFDESIRKKLENVKQTFTESDIDKIYSHVRRKRGFQLKGSGGSWLLYSLSAAAFTVVTVLTISHFHSDSHLASKNNRIKEQVNSKFTDSALLNNDQRDSVAIKPGEYKVADLPEVQPGNTSSSATKLETKSVAPITTSVKPVTAKTETNAISKVTGKESVINLGLDKTTKTAILEEPTSVTASNKVSVSASPDSIKAGEILIALHQPYIATSVILDETADKKTENKKEDLVKLTDTLLAGNPLEARIAADTLSKNKSAKIRIGTDFQLSNQSIGTGILGEEIFRNHISLETGINYRTYKSAQFPDKDAFFMHQHHDFNHGIDNHFNGKDHIRDVSITNRTLEIPIALKYYVPLKMNFSLYFSLGTNVDIYLNQKLNYTFSADSGIIDNGTFKSRGNVVPFNNLVISAGLEKQWKSWSIQIHPYIAPRLKEVFYKPKELEFGFGVGIRYSFGK